VRVSRWVLREAGGATPPAYSPVPAEAVSPLARYIRRLVQPRGKRQSSQDDPTDGPKLGASRAQRQVAGRPGPDVQQPHPGLDQLLRPVLQVGSLPDPATHRPNSGSMGASEVQVPATPSATNSALDRSRCAATTVAVRSLGAFAGARPDNGSRMRRESHVRFCERAAVRFHRATHLAAAVILTQVAD
jgi:hypothetical protein